MIHQPIPVAHRAAVPSFPFSLFKVCVFLPIKMRGSQHDKNVHEYSIDANGMTVGRPFKDVQIILLGTPTAIALTEEENMSEMLQATH